jgi:hypothetical protein
MYTKVHIGTNAFGKDFSQLMENLKGVHPGVTVYVLALQKPNPAQIICLMYLNQQFDLDWLVYEFVPQPLGTTPCQYLLTLSA